MYFWHRKEAKRIKTALGNIFPKDGSEIEAIEIMPNHVHLVILFSPKFAPSTIVKSFKGAAACEWFKLHPEDKAKLYKGHLWSPSFFMRTFGVVSKETVLEYVKNQYTKEPIRRWFISGFQPRDESYCLYKSVFVKVE